MESYILAVMASLLHTETLLSMRTRGKRYQFRLFPLGIVWNVAGVGVATESGTLICGNTYPCTKPYFPISTIFFFLAIFRCYQWWSMWEEQGWSGECRCSLCSPIRHVCSVHVCICLLLFSCVPSTSHMFITTNYVWEGLLSIRVCKCNL